MTELELVAEKLRQHPDAPEVSCDGVLPTGDFCPWPLANAQKVDKMMQEVWTEVNIDNQANNRIFSPTGEALYDCTRVGGELFGCDSEDGDTVFIHYKSERRSKHHSEARKVRLGKGSKFTPKNLPSKEVQAQRLAVCAECPYFNQEANACGQCGCPIARLAASPGPGRALCPLGKWSS
jgi:hypothetical protein